MYYTWYMELIIALIISVIINLLMFVPAFIFKTDKLTDVSYTITFMVITFYSFLSNDINFLSILLTIVIIAWAIRLGLFLLIRIKKIKKDERFNEMRTNFWRFGRFWLLQGISVWVIMLPSLFFFNSQNGTMSTITYLGLLVWLIGFIVETVADQQKYSFKNHEENKGLWIETGLWKYSRHPNYFGEILMWFGIYLLTITNLNIWLAIIGIISPLYIMFILLKISGIPLLEKRAEERWGSLPNYQNYKNRTSRLLLLPNKKIIDLNK